MNKIYILGFLGLTILFSSCATIFSKGSDQITIKSNPSGAQVFINEELKGVTPLTFDLDRRTFQQFEARIAKDGYESEKVRIKKTLNTTSIFNTTFILSWATDALSGKMIQYSPTGYYAELKKKGTATQSANEAARFANVNYGKIQQDIARGSGDYLESYLLLISKNTEEYNNKLAHVKSESMSLVNIKDANIFHDEITKHN